MTLQQLRALLSAMADHPFLRGNDIRVFIHLEGQTSWKDAKELKLDAAAPRRKRGKRLSRGAVSNSMTRLARAGFIIPEDRGGPRGSIRYRLPKPPCQLLLPDERESPPNRDNTT